MRILHYSLGFPPYRTGGLTKYATDLMKYQSSQGNYVALLWPGTIKIFNKTSKIKKMKNYSKIESYQIINPLYVPLLNGINDEQNYIRKCDKSIYKNFLETIKPDVIHIHTLMGIHKEFFDVAKELKIKLIYTSHDYFGICPKVNLLHKGEICEKVNYEKCKICNSTAFSSKKIIFLQSKLYRIIKNTKLIKSIKNKYKKKNLSTYIDENNNCDYKKLTEYYNSIFNIIDIFHFNSENTYKVYSNYIKIKKFKIININHADISDNRYKKEFRDDLKITYLGQVEEYKGYNLLIEVLDNLYANNINKFKLNIYSHTEDKKDYMNIHDRYSYNELYKIFNDTDVLVVPSLCNETFGFVVIEALSYGVPVLVSNKVGAKDLIINNVTGTVIEPNFDELKLAILKYYDNRLILEKQNINILNAKLELDFISHTNRIIKECYE